MSSQQQKMVDATTYLDEETVERIKERLEYGESISGWIREACRQRLDDNAETQN